MDAFISDLDIIGDIVGGVGSYGSLGDLDILGDYGRGDGTEVLEALSGPPGGGSAGLAQTMRTARTIDPAAVAVRNQILKSLGYQPAGVPATIFNPAAPPVTGIQINLTVTRPFKPYELICGSDISSFFTMDSAKINGRDQLAASGPIALETFSSACLRSKIRWETVNPSSPLVFTISMIDTAVQRTFRLTLMGASLMR
jgi:hypothetical protein